VHGGAVGVVKEWPVGWEDDLRRLDADLAAGKINRDVHRRLTDDVLARESSVVAAGPKRRQSALPRPPAAPQAAPPARPANASVPPAVARGTYVRPAPAPQAAHRPPQRANRRARRTIPLIGALLLVVVLGGAVGWWAWMHRSTTVGHPAPTIAPPDAAGVLARLPALPGTPLASNTATPTGNGVGLGIYPMSEVAVLAGEGTGQLVLRSAEQANHNFAVVAIRSTDPAGTLRVVGQYQRQLGLKATNSAGLPGSVAVLSADLSGQTLVRAVYNSGSWTIVAEASSADLPADIGTLAEEFNRMAQSVVAALPPG